MKLDPLPKIIQGGMGAGVSGWSLARAVSKAGQLGVVSGTAMDLILARRLQLGDPGRPHAQGPRALPDPGYRATNPRPLFRPRRQAQGQAVPVQAGPQREAIASPGRVAGGRQLRGGLPGQGRPRRAGRNQLPREDPTADPAFPVRRDARRRDLRPDRGGHPEGDPRRPRSAWPRDSPSS